MKRTLTFLLAVWFAAFSVPVCFAGRLDDWADKWDAAVSDSAVIALSPGKTEKEMNFCFLSDVTAENRFQIGQQPDLSGAKQLPVHEYITLTGQKTCRVTADDLLPYTRYYYRYTKNGEWSEIYSFQTQGESLTALFVSDAQLGRSGDWKSKNVLLHDVAGWDMTLEQASAQYTDLSLFLSAGDQAEKGFSEKEYRLFLAPEILRSLPLAPVVGNHEFYFPYLNLHFHLPNRIKSSIVHSLGDEPYYFLRGNALFIQLESNDLLTWDHEAVLDKAVHAFPDAKWRVVMLHHSLYSCEDNIHDGPVLRKTLVPILEKYNVNLVLSGHTHRYSRSYPLRNNAITENGITYLEGGCSSGCNSKASPAELPSYSAAGYPISGNPAYCILQFSDNEIQIHAYAVENNESVEIDSGAVQAYERNDTNAKMSVFVRIVHALLSICGRMVSVCFQ